MSTSPIDLRDRIKAAYKALRAKGYFCRSSFMCCGTCGWAAIPDERKDKSLFYHRQDARDIDTDGGCYLAWSGDGREIVAALIDAGLKVTWDGNPATRIWVEIA